MSSYQQEQLFGYILDALDDNERESLERRLIREPDLREELAAARRKLMPLSEAVVDFEPPPGLAERTCRFVSQERGPRLAALPPLAPRFQPEDFGEPIPTVGGDFESDGQGLLQPGKSLHHIGLLPVPSSVDDSFDRRRSRTMSEERSSGDWISRFRLVDVATTAAIVMLAAMLIFPAVSESRFDARVLACGDKLRDLGVAMTQYSRGNDGYFPRVASEGKLATAGIYASRLSEAGLIHDASQLTCPGTSQPIRHAVNRIPTTAQLQAMPEDQLADARSEMGDIFGYTIGHMEDGQYRDTKDLGRAHFALMSDSPTGLSTTDTSTAEISGDVSSDLGIGSSNHGGRGQNVLFEDGRVDFLSTASATGHSDHFFTNDAGLINAGLHRDDSVIRSIVTPVLQ